MFSIDWCSLIPRAHFHCHIGLKTSTKNRNSRSRRKVGNNLFRGDITAIQLYRFVHSWYMYPIWSESSWGFSRARARRSYQIHISPVFPFWVQMTVKTKYKHWYTHTSTEYTLCKNTLSLGYTWLRCGILWGLHIISLYSRVHMRVHILIWFSLLHLIIVSTLACEALINTPSCMSLIRPS
jgi:hypothetical protein